MYEHRPWSKDYLYWVLVNSTTSHWLLKTCQDTWVYELMSVMYKSFIRMFFEATFSMDARQWSVNHTVCKLFIISTCKSVQYIKCFVQSWISVIICSGWLNLVIVILVCFWHVHFSSEIRPYQIHPQWCANDNTTFYYCPLTWECFCTLFIPRDEITVFSRRHNVVDVLDMGFTFL